MDEQSQAVVSDAPATRRERRERGAAPAAAAHSAAAFPELVANSGSHGSTLGESSVPSRRQPPVKRGGVFRALGTGLMTAALLIVLAIAAAVIVVPAATGSTVLTVLTSSMEPSMPAGTLVVVRPTDPATIVPGMVMTYQLKSGEEMVVTHRVIEQYINASDERVFITQGDANPTPDPEPVRDVQVRGTVWYSIPYLGWVGQYLTGDVRAWLIPVAAIALFGYAAIMVFGSLRDKARKKRAQAEAAV